MCELHAGAGSSPRSRRKRSPWAGGGLGGSPGGNRHRPPPSGCRPAERAKARLGLLTSGSMRPGQVRELSEDSTRLRVGPRERPASGKCPSACAAGRDRQGRSFRRRRERCSSWTSDPRCSILGETEELVRGHGAAQGRKTARSISSFILRTKLKGSPADSANVVVHRIGAASLSAQGGPPTAFVDEENWGRGFHGRRQVFPCTSARPRPRGQKVGSWTFSGTCGSRTERWGPAFTRWDGVGLGFWGFYVVPVRAARENPSPHRGRGASAGNGPTRLERRLMGQAAPASRADRASGDGGANCLTGATRASGLFARGGHRYVAEDRQADGGAWWPVLGAAT